MTQPLIILGMSGNAYDILDIIEAINRERETWHVAGFLDDSAPTGSQLHGLPALGKLADAGHFDGHWLINAIGSDRSYRRRPDFIAATGLPRDRFATLVHPAAQVSRRAELGCGVCVNYGTSIAGSVVLGDHVSLGPLCIVGHDTVIEDYAVLAPGAVISGFVRLGSASYIGAGAAIRQKVRIGAGALVGLGSAVVRDVPEGATVAGNPARILYPSGSPG